MDTLARGLAAAWRCAPTFAAFAALALGPLGCQSGEQAGREASPDAAAVPSLPSLRVSANRLSRVELTASRPGAGPITLEKRSDGWWIVSPIVYRANATAIDGIVACLAEIELTASQSGDSVAMRQLGLTPPAAVEVKAWAGERLESDFRVGYASRDATHVMREGDSRIFTAVGRLRPLLARTLEDLRDPTIIDVPVADVEGVSYENTFGLLELVSDPTTPGKFLVKGGGPRNVDGERASQNVAVLAGLMAKGFVDAPLRPADTGLFAPGTARATLRLRGQGHAQTIALWVGARTKDGRVHVRTSMSEQVYLVSAHLESSLVPRRSHFERSDAMMRELTAHRHAGEQGAAAAHSHTREAARPSEVPPELLRQLRELARAQLER